MRTVIVEKIELAKVVAIVRLDAQPKVEPLVQVLLTAGIQVLEITSNTPGYGEEIWKARRKFPDALIGAGTIINTELAREAISFGAQFIVTPNMQVDVISVAHDANIPVLMGAMTPTEIAVGLNHGADFIKIFPAGSLGLDYFKALRAPFDQARFIAVGGVDHSNAQDWLRAGAVGIGVGGLLTQGTTENIETSVKRLLMAIK